MATSAALYEIGASKPAVVEVRVPLKGRECGRCKPESWSQSISAACSLAGAESHTQFLYDAAIRTLVLFSPGTVYAGPYTYRRFWIRDAVFVCSALINAGLLGRAQEVLVSILRHQNTAGYFLSQHGEWDSNGQVLWALRRFCAVSGGYPSADWLKAVRKGAEWIVRKRTPSGSGQRHGGLLPPGFSAEHLGPNDYYYWDDFWAVGGLRGAADLLGQAGESSLAGAYREAAADLLKCTEQSLAASGDGSQAMPASPNRRLDSGAIGSLAAGYPLQLWPEKDARLVETADYLFLHHRMHGAFYHDIIHSGINPYLSLHLAQVLLRAGDPRGLDVGEAVARHASSTGQWPEAIHPFLKTGCMGDGQHTWAAAEWVNFVRSCFVREEDGVLVLCSGLDKRWFGQETLRFGRAPTQWGAIRLAVERIDAENVVTWNAEFAGPAPRIEIRFPGRTPVPVGGAEGVVRVPAGSSH